MWHLVINGGAMTTQSAASGTNRADLTVPVQPKITVITAGFLFLIHYFPLLIKTHHMKQNNIEACTFDDMTVKKISIPEKSIFINY